MSVTYHDHRIYAGEGLSGGVATKYYYCYDDSGSELWKHATEDTAGFLWCGASVVENYLVYPVHEGRLISVYLENGTLKVIAGTMNRDKPPGHKSLS
jgi:outer membrane protein assembly factor BamB